MQTTRRTFFKIIASALLLPKDALAALHDHQQPSTQIKLIGFSHKCCIDDEVEKHPSLNENYLPFWREKDQPKDKLIQEFLEVKNGQPETELLVLSGDFFMGYTVEDMLVAANIAKEKGIKTVAVVTHLSECMYGHSRSRHSREKLAWLADFVDVAIAVPLSRTALKMMEANGDSPIPTEKLKDYRDEALQYSGVHHMQIIDSLIEKDNKFDVHELGVLDGDPNAQTKRFTQAGYNQELCNTSYKYDQIAMDGAVIDKLPRSEYRHTKELSYVHDEKDNHAIIIVSQSQERQSEVRISIAGDDLRGSLRKEEVTTVDPADVPSYLDIPSFLLRKS